MADLDVALKLRLINGLKAGATDAKRDLAGVGAAAKNLGQARGLNTLSRDLEASAARAKRLERQLAGLRNARGFNGLGPALDAAAGGAEKVARASRRIARDLEKAKGSAVDLAGLFDRIATAAGRAGRAGAELRRVAGRAGRGPRGDDSGRLSREARRRAGDGSGGANPLGAGLTGGLAVRFGAAAAGIGGGAYMVGDGLRRSAKSSMDFERAMIEVGKATNASGPELDAYGEKLMKLSRETGVMKEGLAAMFASAGFAGRPTEELMRFTEYASKATKAWRTSEEETSDALAQLGNIYQADQNRIEQIGDAINSMADKSASRESDLLEYLRRAGASAKEYGISAEETLAFGAAMKEVGVRTDVAATGFEALLNVLKLGDKFSKSAGEGLEALGINSTKMRKAFVAKPVETMIGLLEKLKGISDPLKKAEIMTDLFGKEYQDDIAKLLNALPQLNKYLGIMRDRSQSAGSVRLQFAEQLAKDVSKIDRATASIDVLQKRLGDPIKVFAGGIAERINDMVDKLEKGDTTAQRFVESLSKLFTMGQKAGPEGEDKGDPIGRVTTAIIRQFDPKFGKSEDEQAAIDREREAERQQQVIARRDALAEQLRKAREKREGVVARATPHLQGPRGIQRDAASDAVSKSSTEVSRLENQLAAAEAAVAEVKAARQKEVEAVERLMQQVQSMARIGSFGMNGPIGEQAPVGPGKEAFGFGLNGTKNKAVPLPPERPKELKAEVKAEKQDLSGVGSATMSTYEQAVKAGLEKTHATAKALVEQMKATLSFTATPTITPRISAPSGGGGAAPAAAPARASAPAGGGSGVTTASGSGPAGGAGVGAPTVRSASLRRRGDSYAFNGPIHVHGVRDVASLQRGIQREADRTARASRNDALHDTGVDTA